MTSDIDIPGKMASKSKATKQQILKKANVFVRVRPENKMEKNYKPSGTEKYLAGFDENSITIGKGKSKPKVFQYPKSVLGPTCDQNEAYDKMDMENILEKFLFDGQDACILAYGQTGSGKTHTMFGDGLTRDEIRKTYGLNTKYTREFDGKDITDQTATEGINIGGGVSDLDFEKNIQSSNAKNTPNNMTCPNGWGIFPRTVTTALETISKNPKMNETSISASSNNDLKVLSTTFSACVIEMYFGEVKDLLKSKSVLPIKVTSNDNFDFSQAKQMKIETVEDLQKLIHVVFTQRQSRSTVMNDASSRSHCIATLFLSKILLNQKTGQKFVTKSQMQFVDLSGSERTSKTQISGKQEIQKSIQGIEGISINLDLWSLGYAVDDRIRLAPKHRNPAGQLSDSQKTAARMRQRAFPSLLCNVLSHTVNGETNCIVIMCVSPSPFNGSETGFTVDFGERFSHLPANPIAPTLLDYDELLTKTRKFLEENQALLQSDGGANIKPSYTMTARKINTVAAKQAQLEFLETLDPFLDSPGDG